MNASDTGLVLIVAFSLDYRRADRRRTGFVLWREIVVENSVVGKFMRALPRERLVIAVLGAIICYRSLRHFGMTSRFMRVDLKTTATTSASGFDPRAGSGVGARSGHRPPGGRLGHSQRAKNWFQLAPDRGLWGVGHTASLLLAGVAVILMRFEIEGMKSRSNSASRYVDRVGRERLYKLGARPHTFSGAFSRRPRPHPSAPSRRQPEPITPITG